MSIVKDLYPIITLVLLWYICYLQNMLILQREFFVKTLTHDFRVSLLAQLRGLNLLDSEAIEISEKENLLKEIVNGCKYTIRMVSMLDSIYKFENKEIPFNTDIVNLTQMVETSWNKYKHTADTKGLIFENNNKTAVIDAEPDYFSTVLDILSEFAVINSVNNGSVQCNISLIGNSTFLKISFKSKFLTKQNIKRIFKKNHEFSTVGYGIKMYLCKQIIKIHRGKLSCKIQDNNVTVFTIKLPCRSLTKPIRITPTLSLE